MTLSATVPGLAEFEDAAAALDGVIARRRSTSRSFLSELLGVPVYLKLENLQRTGSFKIRGAAYRLSRLTAEERARGVVAASAGNHAQGVALAAQALGIPATIFMPLGVPVPKLLATRGYGADVVLEGATVETPLRLAAEFAERTGAVFIHPFDHPDVIAGQGTLGLELYAICPTVDTIVVGIGGGGLIAGVAAADQGARGARRAHRAHHRRAGRELGRLPEFARSRASASTSPRVRRSPTASRSPARRHAVRDHPRARRRGRHRHRGRHRARAARAPRARQAGRRARRRGRGRRDPRRQGPGERARHLGAVRAATSTRCCCSASSRTGSRHPVGT